MGISFFYENTDGRLEKESSIKKWIKKVIKDHGFELSHLNYIFCDDAYLLQINKKYLQHDTYTDIITFDSSEDQKKIEGDIFISLERVSENATSYNTLFKREAQRVIIHGVLHLLGYKDKTKEEKHMMRIKEDECLLLLTE